MRIIDLPPYSPGLNPCEQLQDLVKEQLGNRVFETIDQLREAMNEPLSRWWSDAERVLSLVGRPCMQVEAMVLIAEASGLSPFQRLARSLGKQAEKVCGFVKHRLTSGLIEGFNNLVSRVVHKACGIRDLDYLGRVDKLFLAEKP